MATPQRLASPGRLKIPNGRFCSGKSLCPLACSTQLRALAVWFIGYLRFGLKVLGKVAQQLS